MTRMRIDAGTPLFVALLLSIAPAVAAPGPTGFWSGAITLPSQELETMVEINEGGRALIYIPAQSIRGVALSDVSLAPDALGFTIPGIPGNPRFEGKLSEDGASIEGQFTQGGQSFPFHLARGEKPAELAVDIYKEYEAPGIAGSGLPGKWNGVLQAGPHKLRLALSFTGGSEGKMTGKLVSVDQGGMELGVDEITLEGQAVSFSMPQLGAGFSGTLSADGATIEGTWSQSGQTLPASFMRRAE